MTRRRAPLWRRALSGLCLLLFCLAAPVAVVSGWVKLTVSDSEAYAAAARRIAAEPAVQQAVAETVAAQSAALLAGANPTATEAILSQVIAEELREATARVVESGEFRAIWTTANRGAHRLLFAGLAQGGAGQPVILDLSPLQPRIDAELEAQGVELPPGVAIGPGDLRIELLDAATADRVRLIVARLDLAFWGSLAVTLISLVLAIALAGDHLAAVGRAGFGLAIAMVLLIALLLLGETALAAAAAASGAVVRALVDAISQGLRVTAIALAVGGLLLGGLFSGLAALRGSALRRRLAAE